MFCVCINRISFW